MSEPLSSNDIVPLVRAIRFALVSVVAGFSYFSLRSSMAINAFHQVFMDMLNGKPLPPLTVFVITARHMFIACGLAVPLLAIATLFSRRFVASFYVLGVLFLVILGMSIVLYEGLSAPFMQIITQMQGG